MSWIFAFIETVTFQLTWLKRIQITIMQCKYSTRSVRITFFFWRFTHYKISIGDWNINIKIYTYRCVPDRSSSVKKKTVLVLLMTCNIIFCADIIIAEFGHEEFWRHIGYLFFTRAPSCIIIRLCTTQWLKKVTSIIIAVRNKTVLKMKMST